MGLFKKLKKLKKKSIGHKILKKAISKDPIGRKLVSKDPLAKKALGMDGEDKPRRGGRAGGPMAQLAQNLRNRRTGGGNKPSSVGTPMPKPNWATGGPGQKPGVTIKPNRVGGPNMHHMNTGGGNRPIAVGEPMKPRIKPNRVGGPGGSTGPAGRLSALGRRPPRGGIRR